LKRTVVNQFCQSPFENAGFVEMEFSKPRLKSFDLDMRQYSDQELSFKVGHSFIDYAHSFSTPIKDEGFKLETDSHNPIKEGPTSKLSSSKY
jgi:hypothetical protein